MYKLRQRSGLAIFALAFFKQNLSRDVRMFVLFRRVLIVCVTQRSSLTFFLLHLSGTRPVSSSHTVQFP